MSESKRVIISDIGKLAFSFRLFEHKLSCTFDSLPAWFFRLQNLQALQCMDYYHGQFNVLC